MSGAGAEIYRKHTHRDHILELPDTYIGSVDTHMESRWIFDSEQKKMIQKDIPFNPGFYKIFDEIIVNARDALIRSLGTAVPIKQIHVTVKDVDGALTISVMNDGDGIPIEEHPEYKVWTPELIFGHLLTSSNYDKSEEKIVGGKNGYGAKLTNIFSNRFSVEVRNPSQGKFYSQEWTDHMGTVGKPTVQKDKAKTGHVRVTYTPDLTRFTGLDVAVMTTVLKTRTIELAALAGKDVKVTFNCEPVETNTFEKFVRLFLQTSSTVVYERCGERWEVAVALARTLFDDEAAGSEKQVSFVNGINTRKGGKHVESVMKHVLNDFAELAKKKKVDIKPGLLKQHVVFFINATIVNPSFDSQTKETLTTPASKFGSQFKTAGRLVDGLMKLGLLEEAQNILDAKAAKEAKKTDGSKKRRLYGMGKLTDALWAGTARSGECTLILTEGDSAATSAVSGLKVVGREAWGVFPLKGKVLNVRDISAEKFAKNEELAAIKKILGLEQGKVYRDLKSLRYGRLMIMADQDLDGSHIKGLLMNLFHTEWPSLVKVGFLCSIMTPLLKATRRGTVNSFYSIAEFEAWRAQQPDEGRGWHLKYYKGLGTSTDEETEEWFREIHDIKYGWDLATDEAMSLAFSKKRADDRKKWLSEYDPKKILDTTHRDVPITDFINHELIHFSNGDNLRSLPHIMDGQKPSQRKIIFGCLKRNLRSEIKVAQLAGYISEHSAYHHGEASLNGAIVSMAQNFVGANNIHLLAPNGQFGSRLQGGKDSASPRYIHTQLEAIVDTIFRKEDASVLKHIDDDGMIVEPETYYPVVPVIVINGSIGIGTGFSTNIPPHNPAEVVSLLRDRLEGRRDTLQNIALRPWWFGFTGSVLHVEDGVWQTKGAYTFDDEKHTVTITELPVGVWTHDYKSFLDTMVTETDAHARGDDGKPVLRDFDDLYNHIDIKFVLYLDPEYYDDARGATAEFEKRFHLTNVWRTSNMTCFNKDMNITNYKCVGDMMEEYYGVRLAKYEERKANEMARLQRDAVEADAKARFLQGVLDGTIELRRATDEAIVECLKGQDLPPLSDETRPESVDAYEYLLRIRIDRVKAAAIEEAKRHVMEARAALLRLRMMSTTQMWLRDLEAFLVAWDTMHTTREKKLLQKVPIGKAKMVKGQKVVVKRVTT